MKKILILLLMVVFAAFLIVSCSDSKTDYTVGGKGPAGGYIFYDKGEYSDGWRYLEAGPSDLSGKYNWGPNTTDFGASKKEIGGGKANTKLLAESTEGECPAAKAIWGKDIYSNGYTDWFMPSTEEMGAMYTNLYKKNKGGTWESIYYSSTQSTSNMSDCLGYNFGTGKEYGVPRTSESATRPARSF